jgi:transposase InsO family protein
MFIPVPKAVRGNGKNEGLSVPATLLATRTIQSQESRRVMRAMLDSGGSHTMISSRMLPKGATPTLETGKTFKTIAGNFFSGRSVSLSEIVMPEFDKTRKIDGIKAFVFDEPCAYDIILGRDFLHKTGIDVLFSRGIITWLDKAIPMKTPADLSIHLLDDDEDDFRDEEEYEDAFISEIMDAKYEKTTTAEVAAQQTHLNESQRLRLSEMLGGFNTLFDGKLGHYPHQQVHLEVEDNAIPIHTRAYPVAKTHEHAFKTELKHLVDIGVLRPCTMTQWASPTFIVPKKDGRIRWVSDFRGLNKSLKRRQYPLPIIQDIITKRSGYKYFTKLDLTMMYYCFELDEESKQLATIVTPFGKFQYNRMAMGLKPSPDFAQSLIEQVLADLDIDVYIDDIAIFSDDYDEHMDKIQRVLKRLEENGLRVNPLKCEWAVKETDFLGYWLTPTGIRPWKKKVDAVIKMQAPTNTTQLRSFLGAVTYYRNMWPRRSHLLAPLTKLTGKGTFKWTSECQKAFDEMKAVIAADTLLAYPNHNLPFEVYTDASDYQMGAAIIQNGKPVAYWSRKLNAAQKNYSTMEKELLAVVYCLQEFRTMLLGTDLTVFTDHKNLTFRTLNNQRVLRWRLALEDFAPTFKYIEGKNNVLADCFSRLPRFEPPTEGKKSESKTKPNRGKIIHFEQLKVPEEDMDLELGACKFKCCREKFTAESFSFFADEPEMFECFLNYPQLNEMPCPVTMQNIQENQFEDIALNERRQADPDRFPIKEVQDRNIICYRSDLDSPPGDWKIALPDQIIDDVLKWYHVTLGHCGTNRLYDTLRAHFVYPKLKERCVGYVCQTCQMNKLIGPGYGELPPREAPLLPWNEVAVDLIGPWTMDIQGEQIKFDALTCIDTVTNLVELILIDNRTANHVAQQFENCWLSRYPRPNRCIHDNGGEFIGMKFQELLQQAGIIDVPTTSYNPQANAICERMHQTVGNVLRTLVHLNPPENGNQARQLVENALATAMHATRCGVHRSLGIAPGALVYQRDMFLDLPIIADLLTIRNKRQVLIDENLRRQNVKRRSFDYAVGGQVLVKSIAPNKLQPRAIGPFAIQQVHANGTVTILRAPHVSERINIRRIIPFK